MTKSEIALSQAKALGYEIVHISRKRVRKSDLLGFPKPTRDKVGNIVFA